MKKNQFKNFPVYLKCIFINISVKPPAMLGSQIKLIVMMKVSKNHSQCYNNFKFDGLKIKNNKGVIRMKSSYTDSLAHTTYECKYHIVFAVKKNKF